MYSHTIGYMNIYTIKYIWRHKVVVLSLLADRAFVDDSVFNTDTMPDHQYLRHENGREVLITLVSYPLSLYLPWYPVNTPSHTFMHYATEF